MVEVNFKRQLKRQLHFLKRSCASFDAGYQDEAIRIATIIRVTLHQTRASTSLLKHLDATNIKLLSTCPDYREPDGDIPMMFNGMGAMILTPHGARYEAKLADRVRNFISVNQWWEQVVLVLDKTSTVKRRDIVLVATNKDGGAHVDSKLTPDYERLINGADLGAYVSVVDDEVVLSPITDHHYVALRQMGYEILNSPELLALA